MIKKGLFFLLITANLLAESASFQRIEDQSGLTILSPSLKKRTVEKFSLANGISAYLISDPDADQSAAALSVGAGSWDDPAEYPGMAHLLEHMLFMGTKAYPEEDAFSKYLSNHGGSHNAYTAPDRTVYMFSVENSAFLETLDRFSHFFIDPLLLGASIGRELHNVDQEHAKNIEHDGWRSYMVFKELGNPMHPNHGFSTGNSETLSKVPEKTMRDWWKKYYTSHEMRLVIYANLPMDELKEKALSMFTRIPEKTREERDSSIPLLSSKQIGSLIAIEPVKDLQTLTIGWECPKEYVQDLSKPANLVAYALQRGQADSLGEYLKQEGLIDHMHTSFDRLGKEYAFFEIEFDLTEEGIDKRDFIIEKTFSALNGLKETGVPRYLYDEMNKMAELKYQHQSRVPAFSFVSKHAHALYDEEISTYPRKTLLAASYNPARVESFLKELTPNRAQYVLVAPSVKSKITPNRREKWMGAEYSVKEIDPNLLNSLTKVAPSSEIKLAPPNIYLPSNLTVIEGEKSLTPFKLVDDDAGKVYFLKDEEFLSPEVAHSIHIKSPLIDKTARSQALTDLFLRHLNQKMHPSLLSAKAAGLHAGFSIDKRSIDIDVFGYSEKAPLLLEEILKGMHTKPNSKEFSLLQAALLKSYANSSRDLPIYQALSLTSSLINEEIATSQEKLEALEKISYEEYILFHEELFKKTYTEAFLSGNLDLRDAESIWLDIRHILGSSAYPTAEHETSKTLSLPNQGPFFIKKDTPAAGNGVLLLLDAGEFTFPKKSSQKLLTKALHEAFFNTLRTKQKTAYIAASIDREYEKRLFHYLLVQSSSHDPIDLTYRFELFLEEFLSDFRENVPEERFESLKASEISLLEKPHRNLREKSAYLDLIAFQYDEDFDFKQKRIEALQKLSYEDFTAYAKELISRNNKKRLAVLYFGQLQKERNFSYEPISLEFLKEVATYVEPTNLEERAL